MPDPISQRNELHDNRLSRAKAETDAQIANERAQRIEREAAQIKRGANQQDPNVAARLKALAVAASAARDEATKHVGAVAALDAKAAKLLIELAGASDPREAIAALDDQIPLLMLPLRLETRFKTADSGGEQLWLRIYPDDCWIDSFSPILTETETVNARTYWAAIWIANGDEGKQRAAWTSLVNAHGAARARWIVEAFKPVADTPAAEAEPLVRLAIPTNIPLSDPERSAYATYVEMVWRAGTDAALRAAADIFLVDETSAERATELIAAYPAANPDAAVPTGQNRATVPVRVLYVEFPGVETKQSAWSQAARANMLPDRFVFIGYRTKDDTAPLVVMGRPVHTPLMVAPDPSAPEAEQIRQDENGDLIVPEPLQWLYDFDKAIDVGMGMRINLDEITARGFARVLVIGLRAIADPGRGQADLETLLSAQLHSGLGLSILPQGTPTNNTETATSGQARFGDADKSFDALASDQFTVTTDRRDKRDGQWLAEMLGVDTGLFAHVEGAGGTDRRAAHAMNTALWPATLGYWSETLMAPGFSPNTQANTRSFFQNHVIAGGSVPSLRIGWQPYGILPVTAFSRLQWFRDDKQSVAVNPNFYAALYQLISLFDREFATLAQNVGHVGKSGDPHAILLDIIGLHPGSVEWTKRYAESLETYFNRMRLQGISGWVSAFLTSIQRQMSRQKLGELGFPQRLDPKILDLIFSGKDLALKGPVVQPGSLSETDGLSVATDDGRNYLAWLFEASGVSLDALYKQDGFINDTPPRALLYIMLRHALQLGYHDTAIKLYEKFDLFDAKKAALARQDDPILHVKQTATQSESRYQPLYAKEAAITGSVDRPVHLHIAQNIETLLEAVPVREQRAALARLKDEPTARLERVFADHIDLCSYRLDGWANGLIDRQLQAMRRPDTGDDGAPQRGIYLGGYAWLENLRPEGKQLSSVTLDDPDLNETFKDPRPLQSDSTNQGFIHAPSLNQAVTAAILRNGYISNATPSEPTAFAVNLTSERVRIALSMIEGIRSGQSMSDLLGYRFERGMHDRHNEAEVDALIYDMRRAFPLRADRFKSTKPPEGAPIEAIEARNVIDGLALVEHMKATNQTQYPFGKNGLPVNIPAAQRTIVNEEAARLLDIHDAVADLAMAEGIHQAVLGNFDRTGSTYDAYARGNFPPEPEVVRTPLQGTGLTHRLALHLDPAAPTNAAPGMPSPRTQAEPALAAWVATQMPAPADVGFEVDYVEAATLTAKIANVSLADLGLQPFDWLWLVRTDPGKAMGELDDLIALHIASALAPSPGKPISIRYMARGGKPLSIFELSPQIRAVGTMVARARPLRATDLSLTAEASIVQDEGAGSNKARLELVATALSQTAAAVQARAAALATPLDDLTAKREAYSVKMADLADKERALSDALTAGNQVAIDAAKADVVTAQTAVTVAETAVRTARQTIVDSVDTQLIDTSQLLKDAARFGLVAAGWGGVFDTRRALFTGLIERTAKIVKGWDERLVRFNAKLAAADAAIADPQLDDIKRFELLTDAEVEIAAAPLQPRPVSPALFRTELVGVRQPHFVARRDAVAGLSSSKATSLATLIADADALLPLDDIDVEPVSFDQEKDGAVQIIADIRAICERVSDELTARHTAAIGAFADHDSAATPAARLAALETAAKAMLGDDFKIVPVFSLPTEKASEFANAHTASLSGAPFAHFAALAEPIDFPVDHWLAGIARVREQPRLWEQASANTQAIGKPEAALVAMQFPYVDDDSWLGLEFAPDAKLDGEKLLYTAHFAAGASPGTQQCGLLIDEWTETIPGADADTGITFHHDRPNNEAPQAMLLVIPAEFTGHWRWDDLVDALNETLERAKRRAVEPVHLEATPYAPLLPATVMATQVRQLTIAANLALNNAIDYQELG